MARSKNTTSSRVSFVKAEAEGFKSAKYCFWYEPKNGGTPSAYVVLAKPDGKKHQHSWYRWSVAEQLGLTQGLTQPTKSATEDRTELAKQANAFFDEVEAKPKAGKARSKNEAVDVSALVKDPAALAALLAAVQAQLAK